MTAAELITAVTLIFEFVGSIFTVVDETYIFGVSVSTILYGIGFVALTLQAYHRITQVRAGPEEK